MNKNIYYIPLLDTKEKIPEEALQEALRKQLISLGDIDSMTKFELTINGHVKEFEVYTQYTLEDLFQQEYFSDDSIVEGDEELAVESDFIPFIVFRPTNNEYSDFEQLMLIHNITEYRAIQNACKTKN